MRIGPLEIVGILVAGGGIAVNIAAIASAASLRGRVAFAALAGLWAAAVIAATSAGLLSTSAGRLSVFAFPLVASIIAIASAPSVRRALLNAPIQLLIAVNLTRVFGWMFLALAAAGQMSGPFPFFAGWGDIITGAFAIPVAYLAGRQLTAASFPAIAIWNLFGALDLVNALTLGLISTNGSALQILHVGAGAAAMGSLPWSLVPAFLVPFYLINHGVIFAKLRNMVPHARQELMTAR
jgi:hypothetical protein